MFVTSSPQVLLSRGEINRVGEEYGWPTSVQASRRA